MKLVTGGTGLVGSAIEADIKLSSTDIDLRNWDDTIELFNHMNPTKVIHCAARVGGLGGNMNHKGEFFYENIMIQSNLIHGSFMAGVKLLLFLGSSCIYPKNSKLPIKENYILSNKLEKTNESYALAKIAGIKMCDAYNIQYGLDYRSVMPCNLYGLGDNYDEINGHVIPSLIKKFHIAKIKNLEKVKVWGTGNPKREFLFSDDLADACIDIILTSKEKFKKIVLGESSLINIGCGEEISIKSLAAKISKIVGYNGAISFDRSMPDGTLRKVLDIKKIKKLGWQRKISLDEGLKFAYNDFLHNYN